jgi:LETM1 and EF-hand domain-containing protein 1
MISRPLLRSSSRPFFSSSVVPLSFVLSRSSLSKLPLSSPVFFRSFSSSPSSSLVKPDFRTSPRAYIGYLWEITKIECRHLWHGSKLLYSETKSVWPVYKKSWSGGQISRRERLQMARSTADLLRLIPFSAIVIIPAAELALPFILYFFPNFLPSTFVKPHEAIEKHQQELLRKAEFARVLRSTAAAMIQLADYRKSHVNAELVRQFHRFLSDLRHHPRSVTTDEIVHFSPLFSETVSLESIRLPELEALAHLLVLPIGSFDSAKALRKKISKKVKEIRLDDELIRLEGVDSLSILELQDACRARGIPSNQSIEYMKNKLNEWITLSLEHQVPETLLLLSRCFSQKWLDQATLQLDLGRVVERLPEIINKAESQADQKAAENEIENKIQQREAKIAETLQKKADQLSGEK